MKQYLLFTLLTISLISCKRTSVNKTIEGTIYIKLIDLNNVVYGMSNDEIEKIKKEIFNQKKNDFSKSEKSFMEYHKILFKSDLINKPHFKLKTKKGKIINVYTNENEYTKLAKHLRKLNREEEKVIVKFEGVKISDGIFDPDGIFDQAIFKATKIISVEKTVGKTEWHK
ncbi:hypothetical protein [uncultured Polaribacter sp.]|uniref:hypothetical protein n=1 Tax=uncultured Polaribacter sp. TaxID=174711 RepID=UPI00262674CE|nr:hypothetical protein [uncultured Polaribacter sp.]